FFLFTFHIILLPPTSTLFPYTTLFRSAQLQEYNTATPMALLPGKQLREAITVPMAGGSFRFLYSTPLDAGNPKFVVNAVKSLVRDRKSTRLNSSHLGISYVVF